MAPDSSTIKHRIEIKITIKMKVIVTHDSGHFYMPSAPVLVLVAAAILIVIGYNFDMHYCTSPLFHIFL